ncbi:PI4KG4, partial [Symbiodinium pilosum]
MREIVDMLQNEDFRVAGVYCIDVNFIEDTAKFLSGALSALTAMVNLELPHINVLTKCDLLPEGADVERYIEGDPEAIVADLRTSMHPRYRKLNEALGQLLEEYSLVSFVALNRDEEDSIELCLAHVNHCIQYGENLEPEGNFDMPDDDMGGVSIATPCLQQVFTYKHQPQLFALSLRCDFAWVALLHKGIELRGAFPVEHYLQKATQESPAEIQYLVHNLGGDRSKTAKDVGMYVAQQVPTPRELHDLVENISDAMLAGIKPLLTDDGTGATYMLRGPGSSKPLAVFKPKDEEAYAPNNPRGYQAKENSIGLRPGVLSTQQAAREVAAFLLDHKKFAGVPPTTLVHAKHEKFVNPDKNKVEWKIGALQEFVNSCGTSGDFGMSVFSVSSVHRIGILDVRIVNLDRNDGNLLVSDSKRPKLIPIDHGLSLPDRLEVYTTDVVWMDWPQAKKPFDKPELDYIRMLDPEKDAKNIETQLGVRRECLRLLEVTTKLLKFGAERGLTLHQIGLILYREDPDDGDGTHKPSVLESIISRCVESALAAIGQSSRTASTTESLDLVPTLRHGSRLRRQVSGGGANDGYHPSPLPSPMITPSRPPTEGTFPAFTMLDSGESDS